VKLGLMPTVFATVAALYFAQAVLIPLAVAVLLAFVLTPAVTWLERCRLRRIAGVLIAVGTALALLGTIGWVVEQQFVQVAQKLPDYRENIQHELQRFQKAAARGGFSKAAEGVEDTLKSVASASPSTVPSATAGLTTASQAADGRPGAPTLPRVSPPNPLPVREYSEPSSPLQIVGLYLGRLLGPPPTTPRLTPSRPPMV